MILRIVRGRVHASAPETGIESIRDVVWRTAPRLEGAHVIRAATREIDAGLELVVASTWEDIEAVASRGPDLSTSLAMQDIRDLVAEARASHFELIIDTASGRPAAGSILRLSIITLAPNRSTAFYERVRDLGTAFVNDDRLVGLHVGRRFDEAIEQVAVVSVWESQAALDEAASGGFVGGEDMGVFYVDAPAIEHFTVVAETIDGAPTLP